MAALTKIQTTFICVLMAALLSVGVVALVVARPSRELRNDVRRLSKALQEERLLLAKKPVLRSEWEAKKSFFHEGLGPDAALNAWVKELLTAAQSQALALEKLEPVGAGKGGKLAVLISIKGDIRKLTRFMYQLAEKDPLSRIESFSVRREEGSKALFFELMLGKTIR